MSTPEQPGEPQLTRKRLREIRMTGATPIIGPDAAPAATGTPQPEQPAESVEIQGDSKPAVVSAVPIDDANVDLNVAPLTRRQARQQERIRTASIGVITPDLMAAHAAAAADAVEQERADEAEHQRADNMGEPEQAVEPDAAAEPAAPADETGQAGSTEPDAERPVLRPGFGSELLAGAGPVAVPPSFDQVIARNATSTGAQSTSNALILSQAPSQSSIVGPVTATGEILITGSMELPEGLGSTGHANGTADGKEADAVLIDRELPAHSSPTPIAASAAISTGKGAQEIIRPPAPEKGSRLMLTLMIIVGALGLALVGVLILAIVTGAL